MFIKNRNWVLANLIIYFSFHFVISFYIICGSGSVVEYRLAKARVAGSNPVFRSNFMRV